MSAEKLVNGYSPFALFAIFAIFFLSTSAKGQGNFQEDMNVALMKGTYRISGPSANAGSVTYGTSFIVGLPKEDEPTYSYYVLVTAAHVLKNITGNEFSLMLRTAQDDGTYSPLIYKFVFRDSFHDFYYSSPEADVAAAFLPLPPNVHPKFVNLAGLASDDDVRQLSLHPGDQVSTLGFPLYTDLNTFPVLRSGVLARLPSCAYEEGRKVLS